MFLMYITLRILSYIRAYIYIYMRLHPWVYNSCGPFGFPPVPLSWPVDCLSLLNLKFTLYLTLPPPNFPISAELHREYEKLMKYSSIAGKPGEIYCQEETGVQRLAQNVESKRKVSLRYHRKSRGLRLTCCFLCPGRGLDGPV